MGTRIFVSFEINSFFTIPFTLAVISSTDGSLIKSFKDSSSKSIHEFKRSGQMIVDASESVYVAYSVRFTSTTYQWKL
jgi:hypothetical protein